MGCGNGFYTLKLARLTGKSGKVYAVDIQQEMLDMLNERTKKAKLTNIVPLLGSETDPGLKENSVNLVLMVDVYHEFSRPEEMLKAIRKSLKPSGRIALGEFRGRPQGADQAGTQDEQEADSQGVYRQRAKARRPVR